MRAAFHTAVLGACILSSAFSAFAGGKSSKPPADKLVPGTDCYQSQVKQRVRADVIFDLSSGTVLFSNLSEDERLSKTVHPASLTKLESVKEIMRRIKDGIWKPDDAFKVVFRAGQKPVKMTLRDIVQTALNPSLNGIQSLADDSFMSNIGAYMQSQGMSHTTYLNATGYPTSKAVRERHVTTVNDLMISIRDFEMNYTPEDKTRSVLGLDRITGLWRISVKGIHRNQHPLTLLEDASGEKAHPYPGVKSGKTGYTCEAGFSAYLRYDKFADKDRRFIFISLGHDTAADRDRHMKAMLDEHDSVMEKYVAEQALGAAPGVRVVDIPALPNETLTGSLQLR